MILYTLPEPAALLVAARAVVRVDERTNRRAAGVEVGSEDAVWGLVSADAVCAEEAAGGV
eukprot:CAMPEP_0196751404 /NCGR_PEP_ID=MMETSP1091-20130531/83635_1 /TAXON_ID=302021 /ORGANISM="Rhodomonas sp., Strain CCMP768" /LENGTH=59 /DNA_ID=CAMNT_0042099193 /DNA_START=119 /DNA_END=296 /DNA_ORIENTATION=+